MNVRNSGSDVFGIPDKIPGRDPINHNFKSNPGGVFLGYINPSAYRVPMATPEIASQCVPFSQVPGSCSNLLGNAGRNSIVGPSVYTVDASMLKNFAVKEKTTVQFRTEFFNALNHANFTPPLPFFGSSNAQIFKPNGTLTGGGGLQQPLVTRPRTIQFALKLIW